MTKNKEVPNIYQRMNLVMKDITFIQKGLKKVNGQYTFASHDAVVGAVRKGLVDHGIIAIPCFYDITVDGNKYSCKVKMRFVNIDKPDDDIIIGCAGFGDGIDPQDKGPGKAMSYAYKYALLKVFALETGDDPEKDNIDHKPAAKVAKVAKVAEVVKTVTVPVVTKKPEVTDDETKLNWFKDRVDTHTIYGKLLEWEQKEQIIKARTTLGEATALKLREYIKQKYMTLQEDGVDDAGF